MTRTQWTVCLAAAAVAVAATLSAGAQAPATGSATPAVEWRDYAGSPEGHRYVPLDQITKTNVSELQVAWSYPHAETGFNAIVARGVIYTKARNKSIVAIDATTGKELWVHDGLTGMTERGMNYWESRDGTDRRLLFSLQDYLQAIDATTGRLIRSFGTNGVVDLREGLRRDPNFSRAQSGTPGKVFEDLLILGSATGEDYFSTPGDLRAYSVITGKLVWQFHTIPHPGEFGYETWPKDAWQYVGGANTWGELSIDPIRGIAYFPTGSPTFDFYGADRPGANLFGTSLVALDARTGKRLWHFQNVHHDLWDYDNVAAPMLTTIRKDGKPVDVVAMAGKTGYLYVFNRVTGEPIWPIPEVPVPHQTNVAGEVVSPTQPIPTTPPPFAELTFTAQDINPYILTEEQRAAILTRLAESRDEGPFTPIGFDSVLHMPGNQGGANWGMTSANPTNGSVYVISYNFPTLIKLLPPGQQRQRGGGGGAGQGPGASLYMTNCAACHGPNRTGMSGMPSLVGVGSRLTPGEMRTLILEGRAQMPGLHQLSGAEVDALISFMVAADAGGRGRGGGPVLSFPPGPVVETGPAMRRPDTAGLTGGMTAYPEDVPAPEHRLEMDGYGVQVGGRKPPYTTLTAYDLNAGTIKWQVGLGDDYRVLQAGGPRGTGAAATLKSSAIVTRAGLVFVPAADRKIHVYDADTGKELHQIPMGAVTSGSPSMYELNGRQYLLVSASPVGTRQGGDDRAADPNQTGPSGLVAFALPR